MKIFVIRSDNSEIPLAEIRANEKGDQIQFIVDNTNGNLPRLFQNSYSKMKKVVDGSSHLTMEESQTATVNLLRYVMDNGDVVEITTDGHTVILNGTMLGPDEKNALVEAIKRGDIKVTRKADIQQAIPIMPSQPAVEQKPVKTKFDPAIMAMIKEEQEKKARAKGMSDEVYDPELEERDLHDAEDKEWTKRFMYWLRYGDQR